jgi:ADP-dependent NAD(P)H-hydrate dehydratase / NAD(P)H-hydrate epimerase
MKLFTTRQIGEIDRYTIEHEPIADIDLMERAAGAITRRLISLFPRNRQKLVFLAGPGNNGGDALATARLISGAGYLCEVYVPDFGKSGSPSFQINLHRLEEPGTVAVYRISGENDFPVLIPGDIVIDGLFGSGLTRPLEGLAADLVKHINRQSSPMVLAKRPEGDQSEIANPLSAIDPLKSAIAHPLSAIDPLKSEIAHPKSEIPVISIDIPSGLMGEDNAFNLPDRIIRATATITLQFPKISLLFPENEQYTGKVFVEEIGLHPEAIARTVTPFSITEKETVYSWFLPRDRFAHKGTYGHALLIGGSYGKMGAALLASRACLLTGTGLVTTHLPGCGYTIQQTYMPEIMCSIDPGLHFITAIPPLDPYDAVGVGPGLGTQPETREALSILYMHTKVPMVWDADALNCIAHHPERLRELPPGTILTPHPGEFRKLFGETRDSWHRLVLQREISRKHKIIVVLKGAFTSVSLPDGKVFFNPTGNPGMATGGSGDVLTGIILGLLAQGFTPEKAAVAGVYLHGEAGDIAAEHYSEPSLTASGITSSLHQVFKNIYASRVSDF